MRLPLLLLALAALAAAAPPAPSPDTGDHPVRSLTDGAAGGDGCLVALGPGDCVTVALAGRPRSLSVGGGCPPEAIE